MQIMNQNKSIFLVITTLAWVDLRAFGPKLESHYSLLALCANVQWV